MDFKNNFWFTVTVLVAITIMIFGAINIFSEANAQTVCKTVDHEQSVTKERILNGNKEDNIHVEYEASKGNESVIVFYKDNVDHRLAVFFVNGCFDRYVPVYNIDEFLNNLGFESVKTEEDG